jgi:hypothetical protein
MRYRLLLDNCTVATSCKMPRQSVLKSILNLVQHVKQAAPDCIKATGSRELCGRKHCCQKQDREHSPPGILKQLHKSCASVPGHSRTVSLIRGQQPEFPCPYIRRRVYMDADEYVSG